MILFFLLSFLNFYFIFFVNNLLCNCRLLGRKQLLNLEKNLFLPLRPVTLKVKQYEPEEEMTIHEKAVKLRRPQSPHLTIYAPQLTSMMSITHRLTGAALSTYAIAFSVAALALDPGTIPQFIEKLADADIMEPLLIAGKTIIAFPMVYHFLNGIRHLMWDVGLFLTIKQVYLTGYTVMFLALGGTLGISLM